MGGSESFLKDCPSDGLIGRNNGLVTFPPCRGCTLKVVCRVSRLFHFIAAGKIELGLNIPKPIICIERISHR
ncbi:hypothetical protein E2562_009023 [Oryza meyeriana var. granulata]|uniref:Uncharacterized protein n=1 Tax=Oryza meyeriana var. granulata TaxID=110450 RepID=A0A6G1D0P3_9ORYZ|nr:hypothetical protein E2562_009023 [Oryza meyeriana var. granulata]